MRYRSRGRGWASGRRGQKRGFGTNDCGLGDDFRGYLSDRRRAVGYGGGAGGDGVN